MRLKWSRTFPDAKRDFTATVGDDPQVYVRIYWTDSVPESTGKWFWCAADHSGSRGSGYAATRIKAAELAEAALLGSPTLPA